MILLNKHETYLLWDMLKCEKHQIMQDMNRFSKSQTLTNMYEEELKLLDKLIKLTYESETVGIEEGPF